MGALLALVPTKDWFIGATFAVLLIMGWHFYDKYQDAMSIVAQSKAAEAAANARIETLTTEYNNSVHNIRDIYDERIKAVNDQHTADTVRLRTFGSQIDALLHRAPGTGGEQDTAKWAASIKRLGDVAAELATAVAHDDALLNLCRADRDSLTGK